MILLWGLSGDDPLDEVQASLRRRGALFTLLDQRDICATEIELRCGPVLAGTVRTPHATVELERVSAVYLRVYDSRRIPRVAEAGEGSALWSHALAIESALYSWVEETRALVVNRPSAMSSNNSKPYQSTLIRAHGFDVPPTLITTDPRAVREFRAAHGSIIYKSISSVRSVVSRLTDAHAARLADVSWCPTQFQRRIEGTDYRVHVVGDELLACEIISAADDYRYARRQGSSTELRPCELPPKVAARARSLVASLGLAVGGIDLRRTKEERWYCFEVNPSPGFTFFEPDEARPIADAIAALLTRADAAQAPRRVRL